MQYLQFILLYGWISLIIRFKWFVNNTKKFIFNMSCLLYIFMLNYDISLNAYSYLLIIGYYKFISKSSVLYSNYIKYTYVHNEIQTLTRNIGH
jgi:hypothetical protein